MNKLETVKKIYGEPGTESNLMIINLPYPMKLAWDLKTQVTRMRCHKLIARKLQLVFGDILEHYGRDKITELEIDIFGGCYEFRRIRGGNSTSMHSWGIAVDLLPDKNQLRWGKDKAVFAKPEYKPMIDIFYKHGFINMGVEKNFDWMHFEIRIPNTI